MNCGIVDFAWGLKKTVKHVSDGYTNCNWCFRYSHQILVKRTIGLENKRTRGDNPNYSIVEIGQNSEKSSEDLKKLVTQPPVKDHQLTDVKYSREVQ